MKREYRNFFEVGKEVIDNEDLIFIEKMIFVYVCRHEENIKYLAYETPIEYIQRMTGYNIKVVEKTIKKLNEMGYIQIEE